jgi:hypothetical protein
MMQEKGVAQDKRDEKNRDEKNSNEELNRESPQGRAKEKKEEFGC